MRRVRRVRRVRGVRGWVRGDGMWGDRRGECGGDGKVHIGVA